ncbi:hypothetical protein ABBQ32_000654 [Trebouxia sp. C0010 RCD-2024]
MAPVGSHDTYQVVVWGATGLVGRLVSRHIAQHYQGQIRWAMAGRSREKLEKEKASLAKRFPAAKDTAILIGNADDLDSLQKIASQAKVLISTSGPFAKLGNKVVEACVLSGTHYCDCTGEIPWVMRMAAAHHTEAARRGVKIVPCCGFDSIPSDIGTLYMVDYMQEKLNRRCKKVTHLFGDSKGAASSATILSLFGAYFQEDSKERRQSSDPYCLDPPDSRRGPDKAEDLRMHYNAPTKKWTMPFLMAPINTRVVRRSNALLHHSYGTDFSYEECMETSNALAAAIGLAFLTAICAVCMCWPLHPLLARVLPCLGADPEKIIREGGYWGNTLVGETEEQPGEKSRTVILEMKGPSDPGYGQTSRMVLEAALCLALQEDELERSPVKRGGVLTPASAMGMVLTRRLQKADVSFSVQ